MRSRYADAMRVTQTASGSAAQMVPAGDPSGRTGSGTTFLASGSEGGSEWFRLSTTTTCNIGYKGSFWWPLPEIWEPQFREIIATVVEQNALRQHVADSGQHARALVTDRLNNVIGGAARTVADDVEYSLIKRKLDRS